MPRHKREPGTLPRPLAVLGALALTTGTTVVVRLLPTAADSPPRPPVARSTAVSSPVAGQGRPAFVGFVDTAREPGFDLPAESRRTGVRRFALGHLVAGGDGCAPKWTATSEDSTPSDEGAAPDGSPASDAHAWPDGEPVEGAARRADAGPQESAAPEGGPAPEGSVTPGGGAGLDGSPVAGLLDPGRNPVANRIGRLRALGGDAAPVFGGPGGRELAVTCTRPGGLAAAYRRIVGAFDAGAIDFEVRDSADRDVVVRRARAIRAVQLERRLRVSFTVRLRSYGLGTGDLEMLRATRKEGADVGTVNLLAPVEPRTTDGGRLGRVATAVLAARDQIAKAQGLTDPGQAWGRIALTPVLSGADDLSELDARKLAAYAARNGLAWLSLRGVTPKPDVSRILWSTPS